MNRPSPTRRVLAAFLLPLLLLLAQAGMLSHEISHLGHAHAALAQRLSFSKSHPAGATAGADTCVQCLAFAPIGGAAPWQATAFSAEPFGFVLVAAAAVAAAEATAPRPRSRGPPASSPNA